MNAKIIIAGFATLVFFFVAVAEGKPVHSTAGKAFAPRDEQSLTIINPPVVIMSNEVGS